MLENMELVDQLYELELLRQLKARYFRTLDTKDWECFRACFTEDFVSDTSENGGQIVEGVDDFIALLHRTIGNRSTVHQGHMPELDLLSPTTAKGIWALNDIVRFPGGLELNGYGHYHETYVKADGTWLIKSQKLTRIRVDMGTGLFRIYMSPRLSRLADKLGQRFSSNTKS